MCQFLLPQSHPNRSYQQVRAGADFNSLLYRDSFDECQRTGAIVAFDTFEEFLSDYDSIFELFESALDSVEDSRLVNI